MLRDNPVVLYHGDCADGLTAAWIARQALKEREPFFFPVQYGAPPPEEAFSGRCLYVLDFSYPEDVLEHMISLARSVVVLDHHKTAKDDLEHLAKKYGINEAHVLIHFDLAKSGARLAWEHFNPKAPGDPPPLVLHVEDRDLWKWDLLNSRAISAWLASFPKTFEAWDEANGQLESVGDCYAARQGEAILRYQERVVENHVKHAVEVEIGGHKVLCCNCTTLISEVGGRLAEGRPFGATWFQRQDGKLVYSLRSRQGGVDVSKIAKANGGGGHPAAAGFEVTPPSPPPKENVS